MSTFVYLATYLLACRSDGCSFLPCSPFQIRFTFSRSGEIARVSQGKLRQMVEKLGVDIMSLIVLLFVCTLQCTLYIHSNTVLLVLYLLDSHILM